MAGVRQVATTYLPSYLQYGWRVLGIISKIIKIRAGESTALPIDKRSKSMKRIYELIINATKGGKDAGGGRHPMKRVLGYINAGCWFF